MKKILSTVAIAATLATGAFAQSDIDAQIEADLDRFIAQINPSAYADQLDHFYIQSNVGAINGVNDLQFKVGHRDGFYNEILGAGFVDISGSGTKKKQIDMNARLYKPIDGATFVYFGAGIESFARENAETTSNKVQGYGEVGIAYNTQYGFWQTGVSFGKEKTDIESEIHVPMTSNLNLLLNAGYTSVNDNNFEDQISGKVGVEYSF